MNLEQAIAKNRKRWTRHRAAFARFRNVALRLFDYEDEGKGEKARRVMELCQKRMKENPIR